MATHQHVYRKSAAPTVNDDTADGYKVGDTWLDTTNDRIYTAIDVSAGAAIWLESVVRTQVQSLYKLSVTVSSNDLIVALKHPDDSDPSTDKPLYFLIGSTLRSVTAATSITLADATNWYNAGGAELATKEIDYFLYAVWDSNSSVVAIGPARIPYGRLVSDFNATSTNEKYLGNYANYTSTDEVTVIGRFAATLSAGAGYTWTVPTFTNINLIHGPVFETRRLDWTPTITGYSANPTTTSYQYIIDGKLLHLFVREGADGTSNATSLSYTAPCSAATVTNGFWVGLGSGVDNGSPLTTTVRLSIGSAGTSIACLPNMSFSSTWTAANGKRVVGGNITFPIG
jgi:hypothetical protein